MKYEPVVLCVHTVRVELGRRCGKSARWSLHPTGRLTWVDVNKVDLVGKMNRHGESGSVLSTCPALCWANVVCRFMCVLETKGNKI